jgi:hypothetical protein
LQSCFDGFICRIPLIAGTEAPHKALTAPIAVATTLYNDSIPVDEATATSAGSAAGEEKSESDRETLPGEDAHSEAAVSVHNETNSKIFVEHGVLGLVTSIS